MEKGEIRFHGPTAELLERPDVLRSVFLEGAQAGMKNGAGATNGESTNGGATNGESTNGEATNGDAPNPDTAAVAAVVAASMPATVTNGALVPNGHTNGDTAEDAPVRLGLAGVSKRFGGLAALTDVSFPANAGEIVGFIGPNGAGKTTLFDAISGFLAVDSGTIILGEGDRGRRRHAHVGGRPLQARARPLVPGRSPVPEPHRRRDDRGGVRAPPRDARSRRRRAAPAVGVGRPNRT